MISVFFANSPAQAKFLLGSLEQAVRGIGLYVNSDKTEFMYFNQDGAISFNRKPLKLQYSTKKKTKSIPRQLA